MEETCAFGSSWNESLCRVQIAQSVDFESCPPFLAIEFGDGAWRWKETYVADEDINLAESIDGLCDGCLNRGLRTYYISK